MICSLATLFKLFNTAIDNRKSNIDTANQLVKIKNKWKKLKLKQWFKILNKSRGLLIK